MTSERFERSCRFLALTALALATLDLAARAMGRDAGTDRTRVAPAVTLQGDSTGAFADSASARALTTLARAASRDAGDTLTLTLSGVPSASVRAAIGAMRAAGNVVRWYASDSVAALALQIEPASGAATGVVLRASIDAPSGRVPRAAKLRDDGGVLDSSAVSVSVTASASTPTVRAWRLTQRAPGLAYAVWGSVARATETPTLATKPRVLLVAAPGWEAKFAAAALEEAGWAVDGRLALSPSGAVTLGDASRAGPPVPRDAQHAVVVLLDSVLPAPFAMDVRTLDRFVRRGGGVVFAGDALRGTAARAIAPARISSTAGAIGVRGGVVGALRTPLPRLGLDAWRLTPAPDAIVLQADTIDGRQIAPVVVARRHGAGRVIAAAYRETWRWRMEGTDAGLAEHRAWWDRVLAAAASRAPSAAGLLVASTDSSRDVSDPYPGDAAPWADLVARAGGPATRDTAARIQAPERAWPDRQVILFVVAALALLGEWASRRLRGLA